MTQRLRSPPSAGAESDRVVIIKGLLADVEVKLEALERAALNIAVCNRVCHLNAVSRHLNQNLALPPPPLAGFSCRKQWISDLIVPWSVTSSAQIEPCSSRVPCCLRTNRGRWIRSSTAAARPIAALSTSSSLRLLHACPASQTRRCNGCLDDCRIVLSSCSHQNDCEC